MHYLLPIAAGVITTLILRELGISPRGLRWWLVSVPVSVIVGFINSLLFN